jgi:Helicase HerA, central domain
VTAVISTRAPQPRIFWEDPRRDGRTCYAALKITSAVNLLEDRAYGGLDRSVRLSTLLREEQSLISSMRHMGLPAAFDLRIMAEPGQSVPLEIAILARVWANDADDVGTPSLREWAERVIGQLQAALPRHVTAEVVDDEQELWSVVRPFQPDDFVRSAVITKSELLGYPKRPDAKVGYYFSVLPLNWLENDWSQLYSMLAAASNSVVVSIGLIPTQLPVPFTDLLQRMATFYGRLARPDTLQGGLYFGQQTLPPDAFAADAERIFSDCARRYAGSAFVFRIQVSTTGDSVPHGLVEMLGSLVSPSDTGDGSHLVRDRVASAYEVRLPRRAEEEALARWNLEAVDFIGLPGRPEIWSRQDPPAPQLRALCVVADAKDASCAFRLPAAVDGTVPGFRVRKGQLGHSEAYQVQGANVTIGALESTSQRLQLPLQSLTKHALIAGSTGSGKTTSVLELLRQLWVDHRIPFLVIEPVNSDADDYRRLKVVPGFDQLEVVTVGDEDRVPLRFNPFEVPKGVLVGEHVANLLACFKAAFGLWEPLPSIYQDALNITYSRAGILTSERAGSAGRRWPTVVEFLAAMKEVTADLGYAGEVKSNIEAASIRRAQQLVAGPAASSFLTDQSLDVRALLDHPVVLELKSLGSGDEQALMMALLLNAITEHYQGERGASLTLMHVTVLEEAHRLLARPQGSGSAEDAQASSSPSRYRRNWWWTPSRTPT